MKKIISVINKKYRNKKSPININKFRLSRIPGIILLITIFLWILISILHTGYNLSKIISEEQKWIFINDEKKREILFGDMHNFLRFVEKNTEINSELALYSYDGKAFYLSVYYLYPRKINYIRSLKVYKDNILKGKEYDYIVTYYSNSDKKAIVLPEPSLGNCQKDTSCFSYRGLGTRGIIYKPL